MMLYMFGKSDISMNLTATKSQSLLKEVAYIYFEITIKIIHNKKKKLKFLTQKLRSSNNILSGGGCRSRRRNQLAVSGLGRHVIII